MSGALERQAFGSEAFGIPWYRVVDAAAPGLAPPSSARGSGPTQAVPGVEFSDALALPDDILWRHAGNFRGDRFSQDPLLPEEGVRTLYRRWIGNSLSGRKRVAHDGKDFCTYAERPDGWAGSTMCVPRRSHGAMFALGSRCARNEESLKQRSGH